MIKKLLLPITICFIYSCAPSRFVKPLDAKQQAINVSLGGPIINYSDLPIPMPFVTATYGYGIDSSLTAFGSVNITSAFYGNAQLELGVTKRLLKQQNGFPGLSINPVANIVYRNKDAFRLFPQIDINAYWDHNKGRYFFYAGLSNWFELKSKGAFNEDQENHWILSPYIGETFVRRRWNYSIEAKVIAPNISNWGVVEYKTPFGNKGALGIYFSVTRKF
ncbi:MAG: hypothetical protein ABIQ56_06250 [Chitinophagaceae bacterium]